MSIYVAHEENINTDIKKIKDYIKISDVTYFNRGSYGIGYKVAIRDLEKSKYNILSLHNTDETIKCSQLFVKLVPIFDESDADKADKIDDIDDIDTAKKFIKDTIDMRVTPSEDFINEIKIQTDVYKKTNENLEAVCPPIVYSNIVNNTNIRSSAQHLLLTMIQQMPNDEHKEFLKKMKTMYEDNNNIKLGVIVMSFAENYDMLRDVLENPEYNIGQKIMYKYLAVYELIRLYDIGYMHGDYHQENILINTNYKYNNLEDIYHGRCLIIDYGLTFKHNLKDTEDDKPSVKLHEIAQTKHPTTEENAYSWWAYKWLLHFLRSEDDINDHYQALSDSIHNFQEQMMRELNENYSEVIEQIHEINDKLGKSKTAHNILKGGRTLLDTQQPNTQLIIKPILNKKNETKINTRTIQNNNILNFKVNKDPISKQEFEKIFNPSNVNMNKVVVKYVETLEDGVRILTDDKNKAGGKKNNKIYKKNMKKTTRKKRGGVAPKRSRSPTGVDETPSKNTSPRSPPAVPAPPKITFSLKTPEDLEKEEKEEMKKANIHEGYHKEWLAGNLIQREHLRERSDVLHREIEKNAKNTEKAGPRELDEIDRPAKNIHNPFKSVNARDNYFDINRMRNILDSKYSDSPEKKGHTVSESKTNNHRCGSR